VIRLSFRGRALSNRGKIREGLEDSGREIKREGT